MPTFHEPSKTIRLPETGGSTTDFRDSVTATRSDPFFQHEDTSKERAQRTERYSNAWRHTGNQDGLGTFQKDVFARSGMRSVRGPDEDIRLVQYQLGRDDSARSSANNGVDRGRRSRDSGLQPGSSEDDEPLLVHDSTWPDALNGQPQGFWFRLSAWISSRSVQLFSQRRHLSSEPSAGNSEEDQDVTETRTISVGHAQVAKYPANVVSNAKYTPWTFLPVTLYNEFSFFLNLYFLLVAVSQIIPALRIGYLSTYVAPLVFVLSITLGKEAMDDLGRRRRDAEANAEGYAVLAPRTETSGRKSRTRRRRSLDGEDELLQGQAKTGGKMQKERLLEAGIEEAGQDTNSRFRQAEPVREVVRRSRDLKVGDILKLRKGQRVPADVVILGSYSNEASSASHASDHEPALADTNVPDLLEISKSPGNQGDVITSTPLDSKRGSKYDTLSASTDLTGETFIRTDQLDGETDWKLRVASPLTQSLDVHDLTKVEIIAGKPERSISRFIGTVQISKGGDHNVQQDVSAQHGDDGSTYGSNPRQDPMVKSAPLTVDNTAWANTVIASNSITLAAVVYTGPQTRQAMSTSQSRSKTGLLEYEINSLTKILCLLTLGLSVILVALETIESTENRKWYITVMRFLILFSTIIPISLRVNLDMGKSVYSWFIEKDEGIKGAIVRTSTIPEELGRIEYLLSDKTGTLTQNDMELKKIHVGTVSYANEAMDEVASYIRQAFRGSQPDTNTPSTLMTPSSAHHAPSNSTSATRSRREIGSRVRDLVLALALCHNVTPTTEEVDGTNTTTYQASSPDEIAIVKWTESVGLRLSYRDRKSIILQSTDTGHEVVRARILDLFPFTSEGKRMGIVAEFLEDARSGSKDGGSGGEIWFYQKGADTVMSSIVAANDWLEEETSNMAREGLRTLVVGRKKLSMGRYAEFASNYKQASLALQGRDNAMAKVIKTYLEQDLELLGVTGVEDKLQREVKPSIELLRNAGIKIWMLTGDKVETARCVAVSARLVARGQYIHTITKLKRVDAAQDSLEFLRGKPDASLLIDGESLALLLAHFRDTFVSLAVLLPTVIACRCSPTQKAEIAQLIRVHTKKRVCCIGDGGNDVSMIQAADVGVGIVGKEGRQASLAADFSIEQFYHLPKLLVWHGRNSYKRSAKLAQFVIHRGLIISVCQTMFSIASRFEPIALYKDWLLVGYATVYTMAPVFSLVLDKDVDEGLAKLYPELYKELKEGRSLSYRTFFIWVLVSIYQGSIIQGLTQLLVEVHGPRMVATSFTILVINELIMVAFEITTWHPVMILSLLGTAVLYFASIPFLGRYFDLKYVISLAFVWRVVAVSAIALIPPYFVKILRRTLKPPSYRKVRGV